eukprot:9499390-Pyramimonas_sp.AAC.1
MFRAGCSPCCGCPDGVGFRCARTATAPVTWICAATTTSLTVAGLARCRPVNSPTTSPTSRTY